MGQFDLTISDDLKRLFSENLNLVDEIAPKMLEEAAPIVINEISSRAPSWCKGKIGNTKIQKINGGGWSTSITVNGTENGIRAMELAAWTEYGHATKNADKTKVVPARPFLIPGINSSVSKVYAKYQEVWDRELSKITGG